MRHIVSSWSVIVFALLFVIACCGLFGTGVILMLDDHRIISTAQEKTRPLSTEVTQDLCTKFDIPADDRRCQPKAIVYAYDFFGTIKVALRTTDQRQLAFDQVQEKLGKYQYYREPLTTVSDGTQYHECWYDFQGDRVYPIAISFFSDGRVWRVFADIGR